MREWISKSCIAEQEEQRDLGHVFAYGLFKETQVLWEIQEIKEDSLI